MTEKKEKIEKKDVKSSGVYLSNFVATTLAIFVMVLAFSSGFFAQYYFRNSSSLTGTTPTVEGAADQPKVTFNQVKDVFNKSVIKFGSNNRKVLFVEASDPSCPYCSIASGQNGELNTQAGDRFTLVADGGSYQAPVVEMRKLVEQGKASYAMIYRNGHGAGEMGMKALYCSFDQNKFWQAHDLIMSSAGYDLLNNTVKNDKGKAGEVASFLSKVVDQNKLKQCLESGKYDNRLQEDTSLGDSIGIQGTPGFYVNDKLYAGAYSYTDMKSTVDSLLD